MSKTQSLASLYEDHFMLGFTKDFLRSLPVPTEWVWVFNEDGLVCFQKQTKTGWLVCRVSPSDIKDDSYLFMLNNNFTR